MRIAPLLAGSIIAIGMFAASAPSQAAQLLPLTPIAKDQSLAQPAGWRNYCWRWNNICRDRWGWGWRYRRCMRIHGC